MADTTSPSIDLVNIAAQITAAYVRKNHISTQDLTDLIWSVRAALQLLAIRVEKEIADQADSKPTAAEIRRSITHDGIVSFIDGKRYKALRRHLRTHGFDEHSYRYRYGLPQNYPMVAASYQEQRSALAKASKLGWKRA